MKSLSVSYARSTPAAGLGSRKAARALSVKSAPSRKALVCRAAQASQQGDEERKRALFLADTALLDYDTAHARPGALALLDEALMREDVFVALVSSEVSGEMDILANAAMGAVLGTDRLLKLIQKGSLCRGSGAHAKAVMAAFQAGVKVSDIVLVEGSASGLAKVAALQANLRIVATPYGTPEELLRDEAEYCKMGAEAVVSSLETSTYRITLDDLIPPEGCNDEECEIETLLGEYSEPCVVEWWEMEEAKKMTPRPFGVGV